MFIAILIEETIYDRLIKSNLFDIISRTNSIDAQLIKIRTIIAKFRVALLEVIEISRLSRSFRFLDS